MADRNWADIEGTLHEVENIPTLPSVFVKTMKIVSDPKSDMNALNVLLRNDPAMTTRILQVANSAYYGFSRKIESLKTALVMLGMSEVARLVNTVSILQNFSSSGIAERFDFKRFWYPQRRSGGSFPGACKVYRCPDGK